MGDRISISFMDKEGKESIALFSHSDGVELVKDAQVFLKTLREYSPNYQTTPLDRRENGIIMVRFIAWLLQNEEPSGNYYVGQMKNPMFGDNSDNGHYVINTITGEGVQA